MNRINLFHRTSNRNTPATFNSVAWGTEKKTKTNLEKNAGVVVFAVLLIVCSIAVGCSSDRDTPKPANSTSSAMTPPPVATTSPVTPAPALQAAAKPVHKKVVRKVPATVTYADNTTGVSFQYPRKYSLKTGDAASELISSDIVPMNFVQSGGVALAAVAVPESLYPKSDLAVAFLNVSLNKALTEEQCGNFSEGRTTTPDPASPNAVQPAKLMIGDMELRSSESRATQGTREEDSKYYHAFENGACYEFALKVATTGVETEGGKRVDPEEVFARLEKILATVKINPAQQVTASTPEPTPVSAPTPAQ